MGVKTFEIEVAAPYRLDLTVWTLRRRAHNEIDRWDGSRYQRTVMVAGQPIQATVWLQPTPGSPVLGVELRGPGSMPGEAAVTEARRVIERTLGVGVDLAGFYDLAGRDERLQGLAQHFLGMRPPCFPSVFEAVVNAIACQQLSLIVGIHLLNRLARHYGSAPSRRAQPGFPTPERLAEANPQALRSLGFSRAKARAIMLVAQQVASGLVDLEGLRNEADENARAVLLELSGIGRWSAEYTLLRGLARWNVLPGDDVGARNNLRRRFGLTPSAGYQAVAQLAQQWWPYGGLVYFHLLLDTLAVDGQVRPS